MSASTHDPRSPGIIDPGPATADTTRTIGEEASTHRRISWAAIFGGVVLAIAVQLLLSLLGAGIGLGTLDAAAGSTPDASSLGIGAGIWWIVSSCIALFIAGYIAARLAGIEIRFDGMLHGFITWGLATLVMVWLLTSAIGGIIGGGFSALGSVASAAGSGASQVAKPIAQAAGLSPDMIQQQAQAYLQPTNPDPATMSPQDAQKEIAKNLATYVGGGAEAPAAKERIINIMAAQMKIGHDDAAKRFDDAQTRLEQTAKGAADASAAAGSKTSFAGFGVLLLGMIAAGVGGSIAVPRRRHVSSRMVGGRVVTT